MYVQALYAGYGGLSKGAYVIDFLLLTGAEQRNSVSSEDSRVQKCLPTYRRTLVYPFVRRGRPYARESA